MGQFAPFLRVEKRNLERFVSTAHERSLITVKVNHVFLQSYLTLDSFSMRRKGTRGNPLWIVDPVIKMC